MSKVKNHVEVVSDGLATGTKVFLNGEEVKGLVDFSYKIGVDKGFGEVSMTFISSADADVRVLGEKFVTSRREGTQML